MKDIGTTKEGNHLVEMNEFEYLQFIKLTEAVEGVNWPRPDLNPFDHYSMKGYDLSNVFEVIRAFYVSRFRITELQEHVNSLLESLNKK